MINPINNTSNISFNSRYLQINEPEKFPKKIYDAIYKSDGIEAFLKAGKPKSLIGKILDFFKADEILDVYYNNQHRMVTFEFGKKNKKHRFLSLSSIPAASEDSFVNSIENMKDFDKLLK